MHKNKKGNDMFFWLVSGIIALIILVVAWFILGKSFGTSKQQINLFQSCEGQKGQCQKSCGVDDIGHYKALGCGSGKYEAEVYCCIPQKT